MHFIPVQTRVLKPPQDDLLAVLTDFLPPLAERDIVLISSKVVALNEGRTCEVSSTDKELLISDSADLIIPRPYWPSPLTVAHHAFLGAAGVDESNGDGHYVLLPKDIFASALAMRNWLQQTYQLKAIGVIITDSHSSPFRYGATGIALGWSGILPVEDCRGRADLFGREIKYERSNIVDGLAAGATVLMGEVNECTPVVIARGVPRIEFTDENTKEKLFVEFADDTFRVLYERFLP